MLVMCKMKKNAKKSKKNDNNVCFIRKIILVLYVISRINDRKRLQKTEKSITEYRKNLN